VKKYKTNSLIFGYRIGLDNDNFYIAIPDKYFKDTNQIEVQCQDKVAIIDVKNKAQEATFEDKFKPHTYYNLYYFLWE
jgi:hypothetical protein